MAEDLQISQNASKEQIYEELLPQIKSLIEGEENLIANLANIAAALHTAFPNLWTGFYIREDSALVLGPFQGPVACTRIPLKPVARGVCGAAAEQKQTLIVPNVDEFPGHIACSSASKSEIVVPLVANDETQLVLDIDSADLGTYDETDKQYLENVIEIIKTAHYA